MRVLAYPKFRLSNEEQHELLADYLPYTATVRIPQPPPKVPPCRDADDLKFLELAVAGRARALVTGDADLLAVSGQASIRDRCAGTVAGPDRVERHTATCRMSNRCQFSVP